MSEPISEPTFAFDLHSQLKAVSRSFYLTLRVLPAGMREPIGLAYLLARAADTIADTSLIAPEQRLTLLLAFREQLHGAAGNAARHIAHHQALCAERALLESLDEAFAALEQLSLNDRQAVRNIVSTLTTGMEFDLQTFPSEQPSRITALPNIEALDRYTYLVAGCVGEFWTQMICAHAPHMLKDSPDVMRARGVRFGKALQFVNILRDCAQDLKIGRCYLPTTLLDQFGLSPSALQQPDGSQRARALMLELVRQALTHFDAALDYLLALSRTSIRMRLACAWPLFIGLETLAHLARNKRWLDPEQPTKISRRDVYRIVASSVPVIASNTLLRRWAKRLRQTIEAAQ